MILKSFAQNLLNFYKRASSNFLMEKKKKLLTKSNYLLGLQCFKLIHVKLHARERIPEPDENAMYRFETGDEVEAIAKRCFPGGIDIPREDFLENLRLSYEALEKKVPLFEAGFKAGQLFSRADVLVPVNDDGWDLVEIKSATKVKEVNLHDVSFQKYVYEKFGLKIRKCFLMHINNEYVKDGEIEPQKFFTQTDITKEVEEVSSGIEERIEKILEVINNEDEPNYKIGEHCSNPYDCPIKKECWADLPGGNVLEFYLNLKNQFFRIGEERIVKIYKIPKFQALEKSPFEKHAYAVRWGKGFEKKLLNEFFSKIKYPICYLDINSINPAIPKYDGMKPYKQIIYQISIIKQGEDLKTEEFSFLSNGENDSRLNFINILRNCLGSEGTILVNDKTKEIRILKDLAWSFPSSFVFLQDGVIPRIVDFWDLFEHFHYFDIEKKLPHRIKYVISKFDDVEIEESGFDFEARNLEYERLIVNKEAEDFEERVYRIRESSLKELREMVEILKALEKIREE